MLLGTSNTFKSYDSYNAVYTQHNIIWINSVQNSALRLFLEREGPAL